MPKHHPCKPLWPYWTIQLGNNLFHRVVTIAQGMKGTDENLAKLRGLIDSLEVVYLLMRRKLDEGEE